jgi:hypothetical protein
VANMRLTSSSTCKCLMDCEKLDFHTRKNRVKMKKIEKHVQGFKLGKTFM